MQVEERLAFALEATRTGLWTFDGDASTIECDGTVQAVIGSPGTSSLPLARFLTLFGESDRILVARLMAEPDDAMDQRHELEYRVQRLDTATQRWIAIRARRCPANRSTC